MNIFNDYTILHNTRFLFKTTYGQNNWVRRSARANFLFGAGMHIAQFLHIAQYYL
jgi:hypothetical protein